MTASWANQIVSAMKFYAKKVIKDETLNIVTLPKQISERTPVLSEVWRNNQKLNWIFGKLSKYKSIPECFWV